MIYIIIVAIGFYLFRTISLYIGVANIRRRNKKSSSDFTPFVSVIVPARNEQSNIESALRAISESNYPPESYEIIAINDRSNDDTYNIMNSLTKDIPNLKIVNLTEPREEANLRGKPGALHLGILQSKGDIILMTDADCIVEPNWIRSVVQPYKDDSLGLQASFTLISGERPFDFVQAVEWIYMHTMASAGMGLNQPLGCYGNNLSIRREDYFALGGYPEIPFSITEDMALEKAVFEKGRGINYLTNHDAVVTTLPCETFKEYVSQHRRWAIGGLALGWRAVIFVLSSLLIWSALIVAIATGNLLWLFAVLFTRIAGDYALIYPTLMILRQYKLRPWLVPSILFFMLMELFIPFTLLSRKVVWKGQVFK